MEGIGSHLQVQGGSSGDPFFKGFNFVKEAGQLTCEASRKNFSRTLAEKNGEVH